MYMNSINSNNNFYALSSFGNVLICSDSISNPKTVTFPNGYNLDTNLAFKVVFVNGHNCVDDSTPMTLNGVPVVVNKFGTLIPLPIHEMDESGTTVYKSVMPNCVLEMYYTSNYDGNNNPAFVVIGNPVVLSSADYTIYADGKIIQSKQDVTYTLADYSTSEQSTGKKWINGKPIYCKIYEGLNLDIDNQQWKNSTISKDNMEQIIFSFGIRDNDDAVFTIDGTRISTNYVQFVYYSSSHPNPLNKVYLEYTKTTD